MRQIKKVKVWQEEIVIPTYPLEGETGHPSFSLYTGYIYPYTQLLIQDERVENHTYQAVILENDYLKVIILPELGGHIYSAYDKIHKKEMFYLNPVIKPARIMLRGAWMISGIEFNFPQGHTVTTISPIDYSFRENSDGSCSVFVGNKERIYGMNWQARITLYPDTAFLETEITLLNSTNMEQYYYFWANAGVNGRKDMQFTYPIKYCTVSSSDTKSVQQLYPVDIDGIDYSWYESRSYAGDVFSIKCREDFFGIYYHNSDFGIIHLADRFHSKGKKMFTWGNTEQGKRWMEQLTYKDEPYAEIQSGRFPTQSDYDLLLPEQVCNWKEYWYPVAKTKGYISYACLDGSLNYRLEKETLKYFFYTPKSLINYKLQIFDGKKLIKETIVNIKPGEVLNKQLKYSGRKEALSFKLIDSKGSVSFKYSPCEELDNKDPLFYSEVIKSPGSRKDAHSLYLQGIYQNRYFRNNLNKAKYYFHKALKKNPFHSLSLLELGLIQLKQGLFNNAEHSLEKALKIAPFLKKGWFYLGLCKKFQNKYQEAIVQLEKCAGDLNYENAALILLGELCYLVGDHRKSLDYFTVSYSNTPHSSSIAGRFFFIERKLKDIDTELLLDAYKKFPLNYFLQAELFFNGISKEICLKDKETYLELAAEYQRLGAWDEAVKIIEEADKKFGTSPLLKMHLSYYLEESGRTEKNILNSIKLEDLDLVFPKKLETLIALKKLSKHRNKFVYYYLSLICYDYGLKEISLEYLKKAFKLNFQWAPAYRLAGLIMKEIGGSKKEILSAYEKAYQIEPKDSLIITELSKLYREFSKKEKRGNLFVPYPPFVKTDNLLNLTRLIYFVDTGQLENADELLKKQRYSIFEGELTPIIYFTYLQIQKAGIAVKKKDYKSAKEILEGAFTPPYTWGCAKGEFHLEGWLNYEIARIAEKCNQKKEAKKYYKDSVNSRLGKIKIDYYYRYLSAKKLKSPEENILWSKFIEKTESVSMEKEIEYLYEYHFALGYLSQGNRAEAKKHLKRTLKFYPEFLPAVKLQKEMKNVH